MGLLLYLVDVETRSPAISHPSVDASRSLDDPVKPLEMVKQKSTRAPFNLCVAGRKHAISWLVSMQKNHADTLSHVLLNLITRSS